MGYVISKILTLIVLSALGARAGDAMMAWQLEF